jgi:hypothetical protein
VANKQPLLMRAINMFVPVLFGPLFQSLCHDLSRVCACCRGDVVTVAHLVEGGKPYRFGVVQRCLDDVKDLEKELVKRTMAVNSRIGVVAVAVSTSLRDSEVDQSTSCCIRICWMFWLRFSPIGHSGKGLEEKTG